MDRGGASKAKALARAEQTCYNALPYVCATAVAAYSGLAWLVRNLARGLVNIDGRRWPLLRARREKNAAAQNMP